MSRGPLAAPEENTCWAARDSAADLWLVLARDWKRRSAGKAVMRAASRGIRPRQGVARFENSDVQTLFWLGNRGLRSASAFASPTGYSIRGGQ